MPFITPVLWLDWITISALLTKWAPGFDVVALVIAFCLYVICFWLTVGYGQLGYGLLQYNVLYIPDVCTDADFSLPTDPRRSHFVAPCGDICTLLSWGFTRHHGWLRWASFCSSFEEQSSNTICSSIGSWGAHLPAFVGVTMAAVLNSHNYLILEQQGCFASFSSGRWGYLDQGLLSWEIKIATWIGLNN